MKYTKTILLSVLNGLFIAVLFLIIIHILDPFYYDPELNEKYSMPVVFWYYFVPKVLLIGSIVGLTTGLVYIMFRRRK